ncbi:HD domain-containing protein [Rufibacter ruber]|uniref:HD domain-containing protein n=1 Tax=Rufibacter ruber TaxID=1783499 RepID=UPI0008340804|nr:HD domain-containing protein [Rufibacter ruber]
MENLDTLLQQMAFIHEVDKLKYITRKTRLFNSDRHENDAEHSWHLMVMALVLAQHANEPVDILKVLKMLLIHDLVEIDAGDTFLFDTVLNHTNTETERKAAERIFGLLPEAQAGEFIDVWEEFEAGQTPEARYAQAVDRLEPILQNISNGGGTWKEHSIPYEKVIQKTQHIQNGSAALWDFAKALIDRTAEAGILRKEPTEM